MDAKLKADWVMALRSGEYQQTTGKLHEPNENSYCCLGVLCRVTDLNIIDPSGYSVDGYDPIYSIIGNRAVAETLFRMNDGGKLFPEIADYIEANL